MRRSFGWVWIGLAVSVGPLSGCGKDPFGAPSRVSTRSPNSEVAESAKAIFFVVPGASTPQIDNWALVAQRDSNDRRAIFRVMGVGPEASASKQPDVVRKAAADGASSLIVVPGDSPELGRALADVESKGVAVVLLGRSVPSVPGTRPFTLVDQSSFDESAKRLVSTTLADAKKAGRPADGSVLILTDQPGDPSTLPPVVALKAAAEAAGLKNVATMSVDPSKADEALKAVQEAIKARPDIAIILADGVEAMRVASVARLQLTGKPAFFVGGYTGYRSESATLTFSRESCYFDGRVTELARLAVDTALAKLRGEPRPDRVEQAPIFHRGNADIATEADSPAYQLAHPKLGRPQ